MTSRLTLIAANWKMNGDDALVASMQSMLLTNNVLEKNVEVLICPPLTLLSKFSSSLEISLGAQNCSEHDSGAFTGEISTSMLRDIGCQYVLAGHSERRELYGESNELVADKFLQIVRQGMKPILCIGETLQDRQNGQTEQVLKQQLDAVLSITEEQDWQKAVIAYEPVWAIGTGETATPEVAQSAHSYVRTYLAEHTKTHGVAATCRILYGGSMKPENAQDLLAMPDIDGGLIGGASLVSESFLAIINAANAS